MIRYTLYIFYHSFEVNRCVPSEAGDAIPGSPLRGANEKCPFYFVLKILISKQIVENLPKIAFFPGSLYIKFCFPNQNLILFQPIYKNYWIQQMILKKNALNPLFKNGSSILFVKGIIELFIDLDCDTLFTTLIYYISIFFCCILFFGYVMLCYFIYIYIYYIFVVN